MKAISLWQPWASLMALGAKTIETRPRRTHIRGDVAICSTKTQPPGGLDRMMQEPFRTALGIDAIEPDAPNIIDLHRHFPNGYVLCVVEIYACLTSEWLAQKGGVTEQEFAFGNYAAGRYAILTRNLRRLRDPVPVKGRQGWFNLPPEVEAAVRAQI
jgi:hypothetical protein